MMSWLRKQPYAVAVTEMDDECKHIHAQIWLEGDGRTKSDVSKQIQRICEREKDWDAVQTKVMRGGIRIAYSDWYDSYLLNNPDKDEEPQVLIDNPPSKSMDYYADEATQDELQRKVPDMRAEANFIEFKKWYPKHYGIEMDLEKVSIYDVAKFMADCCYIRKEGMSASVNKKDRVELCRHFHSYFTGEVQTPNDLMKEFLTKEQIEVYETIEEVKANRHINDVINDLDLT